jgi:ABC-type transport system involved in multi-copper enzyme maturation permease subunit
LLLALVAKSDAIVGEKAFANEAKKVIFMLATVAVWFGIINAAREITKEATIYRRERLANLRIGPYLFSKVVVLTGLILIQSIMLLAIVGWKVHLPQAGVFTSAGIELFLTTFLAGLAGLAMGLLISTIAATPDRAISIVPLALIPQIILSGVIFTLEGHAKLLSWLAVGRWAMDAYGTVINLNSLPAMMGGQPVTPPYDEYTHSAGHLLGRWLIMALYTAVCLALTIWLLRRKDAKN